MQVRLQEGHALLHAVHVALGLLLGLIAPASAVGAVFSDADRRSFAALSKELGGSAGVAVGGVSGDVERLGPLRGGVAWSTIKVPLAVASGRTSSPDARAAITASDNAAAQRLWDGMGGGPRAAARVQEVLRAAGDPTTTVPPRVTRSGYTAFGQASWALTDQVGFLRGLGCTSGGRTVLGLMGDVVSGQRWGLGAVGRKAAFKGGWGPDAKGRYLDRQLGTLVLGGRTLHVAIASKPRDGSHGSGTRDLTRIAKWVVSHADAKALPSGSAAC